MPACLARWDSRSPTSAAPVSASPLPSSPSRLERGEITTLSLVADRLLSYPRHHRLHHRPRCGVDCLEPVRSTRLPGARLRPRLVVADSQDDGRPGVGRGSRTHYPGDDLHLRLEPPEHLRHAGDFCVAPVPVADHREGIAGAI